ncbi:MAG: metal ABC transporter permease [Anaerolineae bacterium]|nr:metal ABC transporter permease [Anaerolineae bacterium]
MQRAMLAAILIGIVSGVMGAYVVTRGMAFLGDALAHSVLPGVAIAFLTNGGGQSLLIGGMIAGALSALGIGFLTRGGRLREDTAIGIVFAGTLALGIGIISSAQNYAVDLTHVLIGNILAVDATDLLLIVLFGGLVIGVVILFYKEFLAISFDPTLVQTLRLPGETLRLTLLVLLAVAIVIGVQVVGVALVAALVVTPAATARFFVHRLHHLMVMGGLIGAGSGVVGIYLAWHLRVAPSASIVLTMTVLFLLAFFLAPGKGYVWALMGRSAGRA